MEIQTSFYFWRPTLLKVSDCPSLAELVEHWNRNMTVRGLSPTRSGYLSPWWVTYWQTAWYDARCPTKTLEFTLRHNIQRHWGQSEDWIFWVSLVKRTCNVWRNEFPAFLLGIGPHFKRYVDTLIDARQNACFSSVVPHSWLMWGSSQSVCDCQGAGK